MEAGLVAREELFQAEVNLATSESSVYTAEINYENAKDNFKLLLGVSLDEDIAVLPNTEVESITVNTEEAVKHGLDQRMELRQKQITLERDVFLLSGQRQKMSLKEIFLPVSASMLWEIRWEICMIIRRIMNKSG